MDFFVVGVVGVVAHVMVLGFLYGYGMKYLVQTPNDIDR